MLDYYNGSLVKALEDIYPNIGLRREMFAFLHRMLLFFPLFYSCPSDFHTLFIGGYWSEPKNRKRFFDEFARDSNFDPLVPENWYSVTTNEIEQRKVFSPLSFSPLLHFLILPLLPSPIIFLNF